MAACIKFGIPLVGVLCYFGSIVGLLIVRNSQMTQDPYSKFDRKRSHTKQTAAPPASLLCGCLTLKGIRIIY